MDTSPSPITVAATSMAQLFMGIYRTLVAEGLPDKDALAVATRVMDVAVQTMFGARMSVATEKSGSMDSLLTTLLRNVPVGKA